MKISELVDSLLVFKGEHGDIDVAITDADTGWAMDINGDALAVHLGRLEIEGDYARVIDWQGD